ncbi:hypothetical protein L195_g061016, partial [Trifolium pratense]
MGELMLRTDDQQVTFNVFDKMKCDDGDPQCFKIQADMQQKRGLSKIGQNRALLRRGRSAITRGVILQHRGR